MTKNPFYNAGLALLYIVFVVTVITVGTYFAGDNPDDNYLMPVGMISLFVVSAAIMGYLVMYQPVVMLLDGKRQEAVKLFGQTVATLGVVAFVIVLTALLVF